MNSALEHIDDRLNDDGIKEVPEVGSLKEFLLEHAQVKLQNGQYGPYTFKGREGLEEIVDTFDFIFGSHTGEAIPDATLDICGGAQFGKTILALWIGVYCTVLEWLNWGYMLPDDDLVQGIVDTKLRPDVIEQLDWLAPLMELDKAEDKNKRMVNRKGAFQVSDGKRKAFGMIRGMGKIPTTFSMDVAMEDEKDDIHAGRSKFLTGRMTASDLRLRCSIGTQRVHGRGQHKQFMAGSQGVQVFNVGGEEINAEECWPQVCRLQVGDEPNPSDPKYDWAGTFTDDKGNRTAYSPDGKFYLADPATGQPINRNEPLWVHRQPERKRARKYSWRISQLNCEAIDLRSIVSRWQDAVRDPESMVVFFCDVLALPKNTSQAISQEVIDRARGIGNGYRASLATPMTGPRFAGLDTGDRCWFISREVKSEAEKQIPWVEQIPLGDVVSRTINLCRLLHVGMLCIDARPHVQQARQICQTLNGLDKHEWPNVDDPDSAVIRMGKITWDGKRKEWRGIKAAVVEFTKKSGGGITHKLGQYSEGGRNHFYPIIQTSRFDSIDRVVLELLTPEEEVYRTIEKEDGESELLEDPVMRLPRSGPGEPPAVTEMESHFLVGSEKDDKDEYVDGCDNHLLLANAYAGIAEEIGSSVVKRGPTIPPTPFERVSQFLGLKKEREVIV